MKAKSPSMDRPKRPGQIVDTSYSDGLQIQELWAVLFRENEVAFREGRDKDVKEDWAVAQAMREAFPRHRASKLLSQVVRVRAAYNRGDLTGKQSGTRERVKPILRSFRYLRVPNEVYQVTARGRRLEPADGRSVRLDRVCTVSNHGVQTS